MSTIKGGVYQRGEFWLDVVRGAGTKRWYIWWYDATTGHQRRKSTGTTAVRAACDALDLHYLASHKADATDQAVYSVAEAMTDYWVAHGQHQTSADAIKARLRRVSRFLGVESAAGRLIDPFTPDLIDDQFLARFRTWALRDPIVARRKDDEGKWIAGTSRLPAASTVEESVIQLKAALKHAYEGRRIRYLPPIKHMTRSAVTPKRNDRLSLSALGELLDYTLRGGDGPYTVPGRLMALRRYTIAAICTLARPDAILDMNVAPRRHQWMADANLFDLNPQGRLQTNKRRPVLPVTPILKSWLDATDEWFVCQDRHSFDKNQQIDVIEQVAVRSIRSAWDTARGALGIPEGRGPKYLRHSMATILANRGVPPDELSLVMGHRVLGGTTESYVIYDPDYLVRFRQGLEDVLAELTKMAGTALHPKLTQNVGNVVVMRA